MLCKPFSSMKVSRATHVRIITAELLPEFGVVVSSVEASFQLCKAVHKRFRDILSTKFTKTGRDGCCLSILHI